MLGVAAAVVVLIVLVPHDPPPDPTRAVDALTPATTSAPASPATVCTTPAGPIGPVGGFGGQQLVYAAEIVAAGREMGVPAQGQVIAEATAMQESGLRMYANARVAASMSIRHEVVGADHLSVGLFQQQPWWGPIAVLMDPKGSARLFYAHLIALPGWEHMPLAAAAQAVQRSAFPDAYRKWEGVARDVVAAVSGGITCTERT